MNDLEIFHTLIRNNVPPDAIFDIVDFRSNISVFIYINYEVPIEKICNALNAKYRELGRFHNFYILRGNLE